MRLSEVVMQNILFWIIHSSEIIYWKGIELHIQICGGLSQLLIKQKLFLQLFSTAVCIILLLAKWTEFDCELINILQ